MSRTRMLLAAGLMILVPEPAAAAPDLSSAQWGLERIQAERAWKISQGAGVVVAVVDTGVDLKHPDLKGRLLDGIDMVDDDDDPSDEHGHGTLVAGIIAANRDGSGVTGVAPLASILPVRALDSEGFGEPGRVARAIDWSVERGADILNLSLSVVPGDPIEELFEDRRVEESIEAAARRGVMVLIAAGNDAEGGKRPTSYEGTDPRILVIGATTKADKRAAYSNYGPGLDLVAPGGGSSSDPSSDGCKDQLRAIISTWWTQRNGSVYGSTCGTSMATAFASGLAALLASKGLNAQTISTRMLSSADDLGAAGRDNPTGRGRINAAAALGAPAAAAPPASVAQPTPGSSTSVEPAAPPASSRTAQPSGGSETPDPITSELPSVVRAVPPLDEPTDRSVPIGIAAMLLIVPAGLHALRLVRART